MSIANLLFPQGNFLDIRANAPNQRSYNIDATRDLVENNPLGLAGEIYAPVTSFFASPFYDAIQASQRMEPGSGIAGFAKAFDAENPISSAFERAYGATLPLAERLSNIFSMGTAEASDLGAIASNEMLQSILNPKTPKSATTFLESMNRGPRVKDDPFPPEFFPNDQQDSLKVDMGATGTIPTLANRDAFIGDVPFGTSVDNIQGFTDKEDFSTIKPSGLQSLLSYLPFGSNSVLGRIGQGITNLIQGSRFYRPATIGVGGYTPAQLNQMNALGGFYSEPMRAYRRSAKGLSNMLRRAAADKSFSNKRLRERFRQFGLDPNTAGGMIDSIRQSSKTGYGGYGSRDAAASAAASGGRDYSSSPGAMAGDMEYGEE